MRGEGTTETYFLRVKKNGHPYPNTNGTSVRLSRIAHGSFLPGMPPRFLYGYPLTSWRVVSDPVAVELLELIDKQILALRTRRAELLRESRRRRATIEDLQGAGSE